jgi:hypothetical protein
LSGHQHAHHASGGIADPRLVIASAVQAMIAQMARHSVQTDHQQWRAYW